MSDLRIERRRVLKFGATAAAFAWSAAAAPGAQEIIAPPNPNLLVDFEIDIAGLPNASKNILEIAIDELHVGGRLPTPGGNAQFEPIRPGSIDLGCVTLTSAVSDGSKELKAWFDEARTGKNIRKNITVTLFKSDKTAGRSYLLYDCFPTQWSSVNFDTSSTVQTETLTVKMGRLEFKT